MSRKKSQQQQQQSRQRRIRRNHRRNNCREQQQQQHQSLQQRGGDAHSIDLASVLPANSFYPYNNDAASLPNPMDTRALQHQLAHAPMQRGGRRSRGRSRKRRTTKYMNYAGRQVGCRTRARARSGRARSGRSGRARSGRSRTQSGGDSLNYLPSDANMILRSASTFAGNLLAGLKGVHGAPSALPFEDQALQSANK